MDLRRMPFEEMRKTSLDLVLVMQTNHPPTGLKPFSGSIWQLIVEMERRVIGWALLTKNGLGTSKNYERATYYYQRGASLGSITC